MGSEALLQMACELSYVIARNGVESDPPVEPPRAMRSFLYVADLPDRALDVARQAIDEDPAFRRRVAEQAGQDEVGRAGYLWLHRPIGWAAEVEELSAPELQGAAVEEEEGLNEVETVPAIAESDDDIEDLDDDDGGRTGRSLMENGHENDNEDDNGQSESQNEANAIEDELTSLRGLVDRLASERKAVSTSAERVERQVESSRQQPSVFDADIYTLQSDLEAAQIELAEARRERDNAVQQHSNALTRQLDLEMELERSREMRADIERGHIEADSRLVELQESVARTEASVGPVTEERDSLTEQVSELGSQNQQLLAEVEELSEARHVESRSAEVREHELAAETESLLAERTSLESSLVTTADELRETSNQLALTATQASEATALVEALTEEKIEVASRLADTEVMLDTTRTQLSAVKSDTEAMAADLSAIKAHRDGLSTQVEELHGSLSEALTNLAKVRSTSDADRSALKEVRTERDLLKVRLSSLEQVEVGLEAKLESVASERDTLASQADQTKTRLSELERSVRDTADEKDELGSELSKLETANTDLVGARDLLQTEADDLRSELVKVEAARNGLAQQVEQLTVENTAIQDQLVESDRLRVETSESQGHALSELAHRLSLIENERDRLESDLGDALTALEKAQDVAERAARNGKSTADDRGPRREDNRDSAMIGGKPAEVEDRIAEEDGIAEEDVAEDEAEEDEADSAAAENDDDEDATELINLELDEMLAPPPAPLVDDAESSDDESDTKTTKKHSWSLGPLRRSASRGRKADEEPQNGSGDLAEAPVDDDEDDFAAIAAAVAEAANEGTEVEEAPIVNDDLDSISSELADAIEGVSQSSQNDDEDDLDAISDLISQTVTDFDSTKISKPRTVSKGNNDGDSGDRGSGTWTLLDGAPDRKGDDGDDGHEEKPISVLSGRNGGMAPPSIFSDKAEDPFAELDRFEAVTIPGDGGDEDRPSSPTLSDPDANDDRTDSSRRQIMIPNELLDDEVELARHVVSSPDVVLLVDGDSVAKMGWPSLPVAQQRDALVSYLADLSASSGAAPDVVFDGRIGEEESLPASRAVRIRLSTPPTEPAAALDELVDAYPEQWPIAVVTDDDELSSSAAERGAVVLNNGQLLDLFIAQ